MKWISFVLLLALSVDLDAQSSSDSFYLKMMKIYFDEKKVENRDIDLKSLLSSIQMSEERYAEVLQSELIGKKVELSKEEERNLKVLLDLRNKQLQNSLEELCREHNVRVSDYLKFKEKFKSDLKFQRSMKPYLEQIISG